MKSAQVAALLAEPFAAVTLQCGYAVRYDGTRVLFETCRVTKLARNKAGRCTRLEGAYYDGSRIVFTWSEGLGAKYRAFPYSKSKDGHIS
jgi:hypothetical protein